jgi:hypothetical protein
MQQDPKATLIKVVSFMNLPVDNSAAQYSVDFCTAENMRELERTSFFKHGSMRPAHSGDRGRKVRSAKVGDYKQSLSQSDLDYITSIRSKIEKTI